MKMVAMYVTKMMSTVLLLVISMAFVVSKKTAAKCGPTERLEGGKCAPCPNCPLGQGLLQDCGFGFGSGLKCVACVQGETYRNDLTHLRCKRCTNCTLYHRQFKYHCRKVVNSECGDCLPDYFDPQAGKRVSGEWPPTLCMHCGHPLSPADHPVCKRYRQSLSTTSHVTLKTFTVDIKTTKGGRLYQWTTWLLVTLVVLILGIIVGCCCKKYRDGQSCCGKFVRGRRKQPKCESSAYRNKGDTGPVNLSMDALSENASNEALAMKLNQSYSNGHHLTTGECLHNNEPPKVMRSLSDPGPNTCTAKSQHEGEMDETEEMNVPLIDRKTTNNDDVNGIPPVIVYSVNDKSTSDDTVIVEIPPAEVQGPCTSDKANMAIPYDSLIDFNSNNIPDVHQAEVSGIPDSSTSWIGQMPTLHVRSEGETISPLGGGAVAMSPGLLNQMNEDVCLPEVSINDTAEDCSSLNLSETSTLPIRDCHINENIAPNPMNDLDQVRTQFSNDNNCEEGVSVRRRAPTLSESSVSNRDDGNINPLVDRASNPTTIKITINNNIIAAKPEVLDVGEDSDHEDDHVNEDDTTCDTGGSNELTVPKCLDIAASHGIGSCGVAHTALYKTSHYPVQETIETN